MIILTIGLVLFAVLHLAAVVPPLKLRIKGLTGERGYGPVYGLASIVALVVVVLGWRASPFVPVYTPQPWGWFVNYGLTLVAFLLVGVFLFRGAWRQTIRFPMAYATLFWGVGHLFANGDQRSFLLFGG